jgi:formylglycine-generating enzyme required for sulfatase activity
MEPLTAFRTRIAASLLALSTPTIAADHLPDLSQFEDCADICPTLIVIPPGTFEMGTPDDEPGRHASEGPRHRVTVPRFAMGKYEVTVKQWAAFMHDTGRGVIATDKRCTWDRPALAHSDAHPATCFYWHEAQAYVDWLSVKTGFRYRLPSEAEWEYAARAGTTTAFHFGAVADPTHAQYAWNQSLSGSATRDAPKGMGRVGSFAPNAFGLHDMHGNAWEWVQDCWNENYVGAPADGSAWITGDCLRRVVRGGSWDQRPRGLRSGRREHAPVNLQ